MPGRKDRNLRSGDHAESAAVHALSGFAFVAEVKRQHDYGTDVFCTLIQPFGSRELRPDATFMVQIKAESEESVAYSEDHEMAWIKQHDLPLLFARVTKEKSELEIYSSVNLQQVLLEDLHGVEVIFKDMEDDDDPTLLSARGLKRAYLGQPILTLNIFGTESREIQNLAFSVLRPHIQAIKSNHYRKHLRMAEMLRWRTNEPPSGNGIIRLGNVKESIEPTLHEIALHVQRLLTELMYKRGFSDFKCIESFVNMLHRWGLDKNQTRMIDLVALNATPEGISVDEAIQIRLSYSLGGVLKLDGLPLNRGSLATIPANVTALSLRDCPITNDDLNALRQHSSLKRLNLSGTQITDQVWTVLDQISSLESVCVCRTQITPNAVRTSYRVETQIEPNSTTDVFWRGVE